MLNEKIIKKDYEFEKNNGMGSHLKDDFHSMSELYFHRMVLFATICGLAAKQGSKVWRSKLHADGTMFPDFFIVGVTTPLGDYSYHYQMKYWSYFDMAEEIAHAPVWNGQKAEDLHYLVSLFQ
jgi:gp21